MKTYYVYLLTDPRNNNDVFYCGKGSSDRWKSHLGHWSGNGKNNPTENKIRKIQSEGLQPGVIFLHENILDEEVAYDLETEYIEENFEKLTNTKIEAKPPSAKGRTPWNKGIKMPKEFGEAITKRLTGKKRGSYSEDHRRAISESLKGDKHPMFKKPSKNRKAIIEITTNNEFSNQIEASEKLGVRQGDIANCLKGRQRSVKGFMFRYKAEVL
jgi:hypothetical protein